MLNEVYRVPVSRCVMHLYAATADLRQSFTATLLQTLTFTMVFAQRFDTSRLALA